MQLKKAATISAVTLLCFGACKKETPIQNLTGHTWKMVLDKQGSLTSTSGCGIGQLLKFYNDGTGIEVDFCPKDTQAQFNYLLTPDNKTLYMYYPIDGARDTFMIKQLSDKNLELYNPPTQIDEIFDAS